MPKKGAIPGRYNLVNSEEYDTFDHQVPTEEFIEMLRDGEVPDEVCVVGLEDAFGDEELLDDLTHQIRDKKDILENRNPLPKIQFEVEGSLIRVDNGYDLRYDDELLPLHDVFGRQLERKTDGWVVTPL
jgi:hypothetical protein